jgi:hypothetical protein
LNATEDSGFNPFNQKGSMSKEKEKENPQEPLQVL